MSDTSHKKKLIEVALPLDEINAACKADKDRKTGTLRNIHKWFAPMPLPAWRALLFAALVDDPADDSRRAYLLDVIKRLVGNGADLPDSMDLREANNILCEQFPDGLPTVLDPFCGGGSTLVEAQRLGLPSFGSDLNPVPVLITRTLTEVLPKVHNGQPLHGDPPSATQLFAGSSEVSGYEGLGRDVRYYADLVGERARKKLSRFFPTRTGEVPSTWLWARTVKCPNPACGTVTILSTSWWLSKRKGDLAWFVPCILDGEVHLGVEVSNRAGEAPPSPKIGDGIFACLACNATLDGPYLRAEGKANRLGLRLLGVVATRDRRRVFHAAEAFDLAPLTSLPDLDGIAEVPINTSGQGIRVGLYGIDTWAKLFAPRQLLTLATFSELVGQVRQDVLADGGSDHWADAVVALLGLAVGKLAHGGSSQNRWKFDSRSGTAKAEAAFGRNDLPMTWDFAEVDPLGQGSMSWKQSVDTMLDALPFAPAGSGTVVRADARTTSSSVASLVATDPPYFDAIGYADLSDYFYIWHRRTLRESFPDLYATVAAPKSGELTAVPSHHGNSKDRARTYFIEGFTETFRNLQDQTASDLPILVVYASKEQRGGTDEQTRWSSILSAMVDANLEITGTWPVHGTGTTRLIGQGTNAVASYIVMVCRPRSQSAVTCSLADFNRALRRELGPAVRNLQAASILPVDLGQAAMGPGMQIYSRYRTVLDQAGERVPVEQALRLINSALGEVLDEQEGELDPESRFAVRWWESHGWAAASFGEADKVARPLGIGVDDVVRAQVATSKGNQVQLLGHDGLDPTWTPSADQKPTAWEAVHHLAGRLIDGGGELQAARLMANLGTLHDPAMALSYRLHDIAAKKGRTSDQERYNALINSWSELMKLSAEGGVTTTERLF